MDIGRDQFSKWIGKTESHTDVLTPNAVAAMAATLNKHDFAVTAGQELPPLWHWLYFLAHTAQSELAEDGHAHKGDFLPPIELPRRMWAGSRLTFHQSLRVGEQVSRLSTIKSVSLKQGRSGQLAFICVGHEITGENGLALYEEHDIVYRESATARSAPPEPKPAPENEDFSRTITPDPVFLFRYSALTFNGHRIHYDRKYATEVEAYPGLVVHGPLLATLLLDTLLENVADCILINFEFRAVSPVFDINDFQVCGTQPNAEGMCNLWIKNHEGALCMSASAKVSTKL
ncbi:MAG: acyl-CoA dehydrogenase [SAR86 cluster bacterium]|uniref:Acyl-CoA dehydrogenase n=1 Tax=SAR86 cluster bacterium TaxID=2030880 RepID=A0A2A5AEM2_9GAMM|nr:MAG: acyl-CoA dehydrogenase [SAR86 cluster bacterium]